VIDVAVLRRLYIASRIGLGVTALAAPGPVGRAFGIGGTQSSRLAGRYLGCRDLVAGAGMALSAPRGRAAPWYAAAAAVDVGDALITIAAARRGRLPALHASAIVAVALASGATGAYLAATDVGDDGAGVTAA
jgi:hypothetical protein